MRIYTKKILSIFLALAMLLTMFPASAVKAEETTQTVACSKVAASGGQSGIPENTYLVAVGGEGTGTSTTGSNAGAAYISGETASSSSTILGGARRAGIGFDLSEFDIENPDLISNAAVTINVQSVNGNMEDSSKFWTKAGLFAVDASYYDNISADESSYPAKNGDYSQTATVYCDEQIANNEAGLGVKTFNVTDWIRAALKAGDTKAVFRLQTVIAGWYFYYTGDNAPTLSITTITAQDAVERAAAGLSLPQNAIFNLALPTEGKYGTAISWTSDHPEIIAADGTVTRPSEDTAVVLTAKVKLGTAETEKTFTVTVKAGGSTGYYLMSYTNSEESTALGSSLHLAYSQDGKDYTALNSNTGICFANNAGGQKNSSPNGLKNLYIFQKADGTYGLAATNVSAQKYIYVFDSDNLVDFTNERKLAVNTNVIKDLQVERQGNGYKIYWSDGITQYGAFTDDLQTVNSQGAEAYNVEYRSVSGSLPEGAEVGNIFEVSKDTYEYVMDRLGIVKNTGMKPVEVNVQVGETVDLQKALPEKVTAEYNDGSTKDMSVEWNTSDLEQIDLSKEGTYRITGTVGQTQYPNPFIAQRADPCILKGNDGYYYFTASYPMLGGNDKDGYDKIVLRRSETIAGLASAKEITIWDCDDTTDEFRYIWAPEIRLVNDQYYVFYTSSVTSDSVWSIRPHVLKCTNPADIMNPSSWEKKGVMQAVSGDTKAFSGFSLDMTVFENNGRWYVVWAQTDGFSSLFIAEVDKDEPWKCISEAVKISIPEYSWERVNENVDEGPSVIKNGNGTIYLAFSASGTGPEYCVGLLSIDENADMLDASAWKKQAYPVLTSSDVPGEYGPGHNSFTEDEEGNPIFVYHARGEACYKDQCEWANQGPLYDPCRDARLKRVHWSADGAPILKMSYEEELAEENKTVTATITVSDDRNPSGSDVEKVKADLEKISLEKSNYELTAGDTAAITVNYPEGFEAALTASGLKAETTYSGQNAFVTVDKTGKITAVAAGTATITVKVTLNDAEATSKILSAAVTVKAKPGNQDGNNQGGSGSGSDTDTTPAKIQLSITKAISLGVGGSVKLTATVTNKAGENLKNQKITWSVDKKGKNAASVNKSGKVTAKKTGTATITAKTSNGITAKLKITVKKKPTKITITSPKKKTATLKKGKTLKIKTKLTPSKAASYKLTYTSSKKKVASVSALGVVKGLKKGTTTITVKTYNGKRAKVKVMVK